MMKSNNRLENCKIKIRKENFVIAKVKESVHDVFACIKDGRETTVVAEESKIHKIDVIEAEKGWRMITFDMQLPFDLVGFLSKVLAALAQEGIPVFVISAYSTDHILVREIDLDRAIRKLEGLGCVS